MDVSSKAKHSRVSASTTLITRLARPHSTASCTNPAPTPDSPRSPPAAAFPCARNASASPAESSVPPPDTPDALACGLHGLPLTSSGRMGAVLFEGSSQSLSKTSMNGRRLGGISPVDIVEERFISRPLADSTVLAARNCLEKAGAVLPLNARFPFFASFR